MLLFAVPTISLQAATKYSTSTIKASSGFSKAWEKSTNRSIYISGQEYGLYFIYGYDTFWVNEDYISDVGGVPAGCTCNGTVKNSNGSTSKTNSVGTGLKSGKTDIKHTGSPVKYYASMWFNN